MYIKNGMKVFRMKKKLSIIIPIYNEEQRIDKFVKMLEQKLSKNSVFAEIIFVDGGSTDKTLEKLENLGQKSISSKKGRGYQLKKGIDSSTCDAILFLHIDSILPDNFFAEIFAILEKYEAGFFGIKFDDDRILMKICSYLSNKRAKNGIVFGDQGLFIRRKTLEKVGNIKEIPIMEDYEFSLRLKKYLQENNKKIGQTKNKIITSSRYFIQNGIIKTMIKMQVLRYKFRKGKSIEEIYSEYYGKR